MPPPNPPGFQLSYQSDLGAPANVFQFTGTSTITQASMGSFPIQALTLSFWINTALTGSAAGTTVLLTYNQTGDNSSRLYIKNPANLQVGLGTANTGSTGIACNDGTWHQITVAIAASDATHYRVQIYKDGLLAYQALGAIAFSLGGGLVAGGNLVLGVGDSAQGETGFVGMMAEFRLWNSAQTQQQIWSQLEQRVTNGLPGLVLYWALDSSADAGTIQGGGFIASTMRFRTAQCTVTVANYQAGSTYEIQYGQTTGQRTLMSATLSGATYSIPSPNQNQTYQVRLRVTVSGQTSDWSAPRQVAALNLLPPVLSPFIYQSSDNSLGLPWNAVDQAGQYQIALLQDGVPSGTPTLTSALQAALPTQLTDSHAWTAQVRAASGAVAALALGPYGNTAALVPPTLTLSYQAGASGNSLQASWTSQLGADAYFLQVFKQNGTAWNLVYSQWTTQTSQPINSTAVPTQEGDVFKALVRAVGLGAIGPWSPAQQVTVATLAAPVLTFAWTAATAALSVTWPDIRTASQSGLTVTYNVSLFQDANPTPINTATGLPNTAAGRTYVLPDELAVNSTFKVIVQGFASGVIGLPSVPPPLTAPNVTGATYAAANGQVQAVTDGSGATYYYGEVLSGVTVAASLMSPTANLSIPFSPASGTVYTVQVRALLAGVLTNYSGTTQTFTAYPGMVAPVVAAPTVVAGAGSGSVAASWTFDESIYPADSVSYLVALSGDATGSQTVSGSQSATFNNLTVASGKTYAISVQAQSGHTLGRAGSNTTIANAPAQVQGVNVSTDAAVDIVTRWTLLSGSGITYKIQITGPNGFLYNDPNPETSGNVTLSQSQTGVVKGTTYQVAVAAVQSGLTGPWSATVSIEAGKVPDVCPNCQPNPPQEGDPINLSTGAFGVENLDLAFDGIFPIRFQRYYRTSIPIASENPAYTGKPMGNRWNHEFNTCILADTNSMKAYVLWGDGGVEVFRIPSGITGNYPTDGVYDGTTLNFGSNLVYTLTLKDQTQYLFNQAGQLTGILSPIGNSLSLNYSGGQLQKVVDNQNATWVQFAYYASGQISGLTDSAGRTVGYAYYGNGDLKTCTDPLGGVITYVYWDGQWAGKSLIQTGSDQNGNVFVYNEYASWVDGSATRYRVTFQQDANAYAAGTTPGSRYGLNISYQSGTLSGQDVIIATVTDNAGAQTIYTSVKANGNQLSRVTILPSNAIYQKTYTYNAFNNCLTETEYEGPASQAAALVGNTRTMSYDADLNLLTIAYAAPIGQIQGCTYYPNNSIKTATDLNGNVTQFSYNPDNTLLSITNPLGTATRFTYYPGTVKGLVHTKTDPMGNVWTYTYTQDQVNTVTDPLGNVTVYAWNGMRLCGQITYQDAHGNTLKQEILTPNAMGFLLSEKSQFPGQSAADAYATNQVPTALNQTRSRTDALGNQTSFTYYPGLNLHTVTYPAASNLQSVTTLAYDPDNRLKSIAYSPAVQENFAYDALGRESTYTDPDGQAYATVYAMVFTGQQAPFPRSTALQYPLLTPHSTACQTVDVTDVLNRLISHTDRSGQAWRFAYSKQAAPSGNSFQSITTLTLPPANASDPGTQYQVIEILDALGRLISRTDEAGKVTTVAYQIQSGGPNGSYVTLATITEPSGRITVNTLDALGRTIQIAEGQGTAQLATQYGYDALNRLVSVINIANPSNITTGLAYAYDSAQKTLTTTITGPGANESQILTHNGVGQLLARTDALGHSETYGYFPRGFLHTLARANGKTLAYDYDNAGRYFQLTRSDGSVVKQTLDANGNRLNTQVNGNAVITRTFDPWNRMLSRVNAHNETIGYAYTATDQLATLTYPAPGTGSAPVVTYGYDGLHRMQTVTDWANRVTRYGYYPTGLLQSIAYPNQCATSFQTDGGGRIKGLTNTAANQVISSSEYAFDALGQPSSATVQTPMPSTPAAAGNTLVYDNADELTTLNGAALTYDPSGNTTSLPGVASLVHDDFNLLTAYGPDQYAYDADALRETSTVNGTVLRFVSTPGNQSAPYLEPAGSGRAWDAVSSQREPWGYVYKAPSGRMDAPTGDGSPLSRILQTVESSGALHARYIYGLGLIGQEKPDGTYRGYLFDDRGSTLALTDGNGQMTGCFAYDPYGALIGQEGESAPFLYNGRDGTFTDGNGLYFMGSRYFRPAQWRFLERDAWWGDLSDPRTLNAYAYVVGNPIQYVDPLGLSHSSGWSIFGKVVGGIVGGVVGGAIIGGIVGGIAGSSTASGVGGSVAGGIIGGVVGGLVGGPVGGVVGGIGGAAGGGLLGGSAPSFGTGLVEGAMVDGAGAEAGTAESLGSRLGGYLVRQGPRAGRFAERVGRFLSTNGGRLPLRALGDIELM